MRLSHWMIAMTIYIPARIKFVVNRRMNVSNFEEVGQMRRRSGISMKTMRNELAL